METFDVPRVKDSRGTFSGQRRRQSLSQDRIWICFDDQEGAYPFFVQFRKTNFRLSRPVSDQDELTNLKFVQDFPIIWRLSIFDDLESNALCFTNLL